jgi:hypothetical protein
MFFLIAPCNKNRASLREKGGLATTGIYRIFRLPRRILLTVSTINRGIQGIRLPHAKSIQQAKPEVSSFSACAARWLYSMHLCRLPADWRTPEKYVDS